MSQPNENIVRFRQPNFKVQRPFVKYERKVILEAFKSTGISRSAAGIYLAMGLLVEEANSATITASYTEIMDAALCCKRTLMSGLKELEELKFLSTEKSSGKKTSYKLLVGIFNGIRENNHKLSTGYPQDFEPGAKDHHVPGAKSHPVRAHVYKPTSAKETSTEIKKEQQQEDVVVFCRDSQFRNLNKELIEKAISDYGIEIIQKKITRLESSYSNGEKIKTSAEALFVSALKNKDFDSSTEIERRQKEQRRKVDEQRIRAKEHEFYMQRKREEDEEKREVLLARIRQDHPHIFRNVEFQMQNENLAFPQDSIAYEHVLENRAIQEFKKMGEIE